MTTAIAGDIKESGIEPGLESNPVRDGEALAIVKRWSLWSMAPGVLPFPLLDLAAVGAIQIKMLTELSHLYGTRFSENKFKNVSAALLGSFGAAMAGTGVAFSLLKAVPLIGPAAGALALPVVAGASTYAIGRVFQAHFASGGTFLTFDPEAARGKFNAFYEEYIKTPPATKLTKKEAAAAAK